ncbi:unnamed protein product [Prorocentrum cordatum]|uniref:Uncharacterized protein n=1 Tax=Prorocentrum cordatum TaxID=2364126 RepID=A0ABN9TBP6_9DINO|nr:unnamed protein product [Polarella glacialis]
MAGAGPGRHRTKRLVLIRHGRSTWNEFLGQHRQRQSEEQREPKRAAGLRGTLKHMVRGKARGPDAAEGPEGSPGGGAEDGDDFINFSSGGGGPQGYPAGAQRGLLASAARGVRKVGNALSHAKAYANQVDHPLSPGGLLQARALREAVGAAFACSPQPEDGDGAAALLACKSWYISPLLRALQTAAYALDGLKRRDPGVKLLVTPDAREIVKSRYSIDCEGKKDNVGVKVVARALAKTAETIADAETDDPTNRHLTESRQAELFGISSVLCALDLKEVGQEWWDDVRHMKKEDLRGDDDRVRRLTMRLLQDPAPIAGVVGHSLLFQRMIQLFLPRDRGEQLQIKAAMRNGAPETTKDPFDDKIMNCGVLVLTCRYPEREEGVPDLSKMEIQSVEFLFDGRMESALPPSETLGAEPQDLESYLGDFLDGGPEL